jgi:hypothetical protein
MWGDRNPPVAPKANRQMVRKKGRNTDTPFISLFTLWSFVGFDGYNFGRAKNEVEIEKPLFLTPVL